MSNNFEKIIVPSASVILFILPFFIKTPYLLHILISVFINIIFICSLRFVLITGHLNLAHPAFMAIGAYTTAVLSIKYNISFWLTLPLGVAINLMVAIGLGFIILGVKGVYFFLVTFAFAEVVRLFLSNFFINILGGVSGLLNIPHPRIALFNLFEIQLTTKVHYYYLGLIFMVLSVLILYRLEKSRFGQALHAIGQNDNLVRSIGINVFKHKLSAFVIGASFASLAGSLFSPFNRVICPEEFGVPAGILMVTYLVIGGKDSFYGPIIGVCVLIPLLSFVLAPLGSYNLLILGLTLIVVLVFLREGLVSLPQRILAMNKQYGKGK